MRFVAKLAAAVLLLSGTAASAVTVFSESFSFDFVGASLVSNDSSDRFGDTDYFFINNVGGWTFNTNNTFAAVSFAREDVALLINENGGGGSATRLISGLTIGQQYSLSFLLSGDNRPGQAYVLTGGIAGLSFTVNGTVGAAGTNPGSLLTYGFTATSSSHLLSFGQTSVSDGSPIIDNISIDTVGAAIPEPASWAMLLAGFGLVGFAARRRRAVAA
ncbi:PEPxxWA-CTERM sorting domain-containing protein [Sandarakinorhabdus sp.]|uniref:PEPxxWA-CTERM sorting domain-containing protein n=1 Tax=Sandarakinorhabdus sp. TaxID=1916663 RepID=UPI00286DD42F|nr:PEPxxWA-CTERM sorting domain-containing protein [Sandarakinorhabdus sp.]